MAFSPNPLKAKLEAGQVVYGTCICSFSPNITELAGYCGFEFVRIDNEHAWRQDASIENVIRGALLTGMLPIARIDKDDPFIIRKALEVGAGGIIIPDIHSSDEVRAIAALPDCSVLLTGYFSGTAVFGTGQSN